MFLVRDPSNPDILVFTEADPRDDGYPGEVTAGVTLAERPADASEWEGGHDRPGPVVLAVSVTDPKGYRVFTEGDDITAAGFRPVGCPLFVFRSWVDYRPPPAPGVHPGPGRFE